MDGLTWPSIPRIISYLLYQWRAMSWMCVGFFGRRAKLVRKAFCFRVYWWPQLDPNFTDSLPRVFTRRVNLQQKSAESPRFPSANLRNCAQLFFDSLQPFRICCLMKVECNFLTFGRTWLCQHLVLVDERKIVQMVWGGAQKYTASFGWAEVAKGGLVGCDRAGICGYRYWRIGWCLSSRDLGGRRFKSCPTTILFLSEISI